MERKFCGLEGCLGYTEDEQVGCYTGCAKVGCKMRGNQMKESLSPETNAKHAAGMTRAPMFNIPPLALLWAGYVMRRGADKYGAYNWVEGGVVYSVYHNAILRHMGAILMGQWFDPDDQAPHMAHVMACASIVIDAKERGVLKEDLPTPGSEHYVRVLNEIKELMEGSGN